MLVSQRAEHCQCSRSSTIHGGELFLEPFTIHCSAPPRVKPRSNLERIVAPYEEPYEVPDRSLTDDDMTALWNREADLHISTRKGGRYERDPVPEDSDDEEGGTILRVPADVGDAGTLSLHQVVLFCITCHRLMRRRFSPLRSSEPRRHTPGRSPSLGGG
jgi:hypothetical protein